MIFTLLSVHRTQTKTFASSVGITNLRDAPSYAPRDHPLQMLTLIIRKRDILKAANTHEVRRPFEITGRTPNALESKQPLKIYDSVAKKEIKLMVSASLTAFKKPTSPGNSSKYLGHTADPHHNTSLARKSTYKSVARSKP